jgi:hypothetical protein
MKDLPVEREFDAELQRLLSALCDDSLDEHDRAHLAGLLETNPAAQQKYIEFLHLDVCLQYGRCADMQDAELPIVGGATAAARLERSFNTPLAFSDSQSQSVGCSQVASYFTLPRTLIVTTGIFAMLLMFWVAREGSRVDKSPELPMVTSLVSKGTTTTMHLKGIGQVTMDRDAKFALLAHNRARLDSGRIRMRVTEATGRGFVVETPDGEITDLGTEFGVDVNVGKDSALAVFEGAVDLKIADLATNSTRVERLLGGDGVLFNKAGQLNRLNSIMTGSGAKFAVCGDSSNVSFDSPVIVDVYDSLPTGSTKRYYEIVPCGMEEDALAYVDHTDHNWNGMSRTWRIPRFLRGGDYVKTFASDKRRTTDFEMTVVLGKPAMLYVLADRRLTVPDWLSKDFERTSERIGMDTGRRYVTDAPREKGRFATGVGAGNSIDLEFDIWSKRVAKPGAIKLGPNGEIWREPAKNREAAYMYGIVAVEIESKGKLKKKPPVVQTTKNAVLTDKK